MIFRANVGAIEQARFTLRRAALGVKRQLRDFMCMAHWPETERTPRKNRQRPYPRASYKNLETIASNEKKTLHWSVGSNATADRKWLLDTYAECLAAVSGKRRGPIAMIDETMTQQEAADALR